MHNNRYIYVHFGFINIQKNQKTKRSVITNECMAWWREMKKQILSTKGHFFKNFKKLLTLLVYVVCVVDVVGGGGGVFHRKNVKVWAQDG